MGIRQIPRRGRGGSHGGATRRPSPICQEKSKTDRDAKIWVNLCQNAGMHCARPPSHRRRWDLLGLGNMRVAYRVDGGMGILSH